METASLGYDVFGSATPIPRNVTRRVLRVAFVVLLALLAMMPVSALAQPNVDGLCVVKAEGTLLCWGQGIYGRNGDGAYQDRFAPVRVGEFGEWKQVSGRRATTCAVKKNGTLWCWGRNDTHQLGNGGTQYRNTPQKVGADSDWKQVSVEGQSVCGVKTTGLAKCWGYGTSGQLGDGTIFTKQTPSNVVGSDWREIQTGGHFACGLKNDNTLWCWGKNGEYQFGKGAQYGIGSFGTPDQIDNTGRWASVNLGHKHGCGIQRSDASLWCWGTNSAGEVGDGTASSPQYINNDGFPPRKASPVPVDVPPGTRWKKVDASGRRTCGIQENGTLWCWGVSETDILSPKQVGTRSDWIDIGGYCGLRGTDTLECWGGNTAGSLAIGVDPFIYEPVQVPPDGPWSAFSAGSNATCGIRNSELYCWGNGTYGVIGNGRHRSQQSPTRVGTDSNWKDVHVGLIHACGLRTDKTIWCWGGGLQGQLGNNFNWYQPSPKKVTGTQQAFESMDSGYKHTCAIADDGSLWCWGGNTSGENGQSSSNAVTQPAKVGSDVDWKQIAMGTNHSCALKDDNSLWCWGSNIYGQLGQGTTGGNSVTPARVGAANDWRQVSAGYWGSCATKNDNSLWCWGELDYYHKLGMQWSSPTQLHDHIQWQQAATDLGGFCGLDTAGHAWCWGRVRSTVDYVNDVIYTEPHRMSDSLVFDDIDMGLHHVVASTTTDEMWCWHELHSNACGQGKNVEVPVGIVDNTPPTVTVTDGPNQPEDSSKDVTLTFHASEDSKFECRLNNGQWELCSSPATFSNVPRGAVDAQVRATDLYGNTSAPVSYQWNAPYIVAAPNTIITEGPADASPQAAYPHFEFETEQEADGYQPPVDHFQCQLVRESSSAVVDTDDEIIGTFANCNELNGNPGAAVSGGQNYKDLQNGLEEGQYRLDVVAVTTTDGNETMGEVASFQWVVRRIDLSINQNHSCLITRQGQIQCWGRNELGQLGQGDYLNKNHPTAVPHDTTWLQVATAESASCAIDRYGELFCWGDNSSGQIGQATFVPAQYNLPQPVSVNGEIASDWISIEAGEQHFCGLRQHDNGDDEQTTSLWCWGSNSVGQLGNNAAESSATPVTVLIEKIEGTEVVLRPNDYWVQLTVGSHHACAIADEPVSEGSDEKQRHSYCWGDNAYGQHGNASNVLSRFATEIPSGQYELLRAGGDHSCGIKRNRTNSDGSDSDNDQLTLECWGRNYRGQTASDSDQSSEPQVIVAPDNSKWLDVSTGRQHSCGHLANNQVYCWGRNERGELGAGDGLQNANDDIAKPLPENGAKPLLGDGSGWQLTALADRHSCAVSNNYELHCWGQRIGERLGEGDITASVVRSNGMSTVVNNQNTWNLGTTHDHHYVLGANANSNCATTEDGKLLCWGHNSSGNLADGSDRDRQLPALVPTASDGTDIRWDYVQTGRRNGCALQHLPETGADSAPKHDLYCWGASAQLAASESTGEAATPPSTNQLTPSLIVIDKAHPVPLSEQPDPRVLNDFSQQGMAIGQQHSCVVATYLDPTPATALSSPKPPSNRLFCWGDNQFGQLGLGSDPQPSYSNVTVVGDDRDWAGAAAGSNHSCAWKKDGNLHCWGDNRQHQVSTTVVDAVAEPQLQPLNIDVTQAAAGRSHTCALGNSNNGGSNGEIWCWGNNESGQLGNGNLNHQKDPVRISAPTGQHWKFIASGNQHSCALSTNSAGSEQELHCWGSNQVGQVQPDSDLSYFATPQQLPGNWQALAVGEQHSCALNADGEMKCWGNNFYGQRGEGKAWGENPQTMIISDMESK